MALALPNRICSIKKLALVYSVATHVEVHSGLGLSYFGHQSGPEEESREMCYLFLQVYSCVWCGRQNNDRRMTTIVLRTGRSDSLQIVAQSARLTKRHVQCETR